MPTQSHKCNKCGADTTIDLDYLATYSSDATCRKCCHAYAVYETRVMAKIQEKKNVVAIANDPKSRTIDVTSAHTLAADLAEGFSAQYVGNWCDHLRSVGFDAISKIAEGKYYNVAFLVGKQRQDCLEKGYLQVEKAAF